MASKKMNILVIGGAGFIGSHMCKYLSKAGYYPVVLDSLICGHREAVKWGPLIEGSMADQALLKHIFKEYFSRFLKNIDYFIDRNIL